MRWLILQKSAVRHLRKVAVRARFSHSADDKLFSQLRLVKSGLNAPEVLGAAGLAYRQAEAVARERRDANWLPSICVATFQVRRAD